MRIAMPSLILLACITMATSALAAQTEVAEKPTLEVPAAQPEAQPEAQPAVQSLGQPEAQSVGQPEVQPELQAEPTDSTKIQPAAPPVEFKRMPRLVVTITGLAASKGSVEVSLFNSEESFMVKPFFQESGVPDENGRVEVRFLNVFEGEYGLVVVHDENGNGLYDSGFLGFGAEPVAYSNNAKPWLGRPSFDSVKFDVQETMEIEISMD